MPFERPTSINEVLQHMHRHEYVLPAIQREFVWEPDKITSLFDSLMQGYPIGSLLFWKIEPDTIKKYRFYDFVRDYHERDRPHCPELDIANPHIPLVGILDGQQRLSALNIGFRGAYAFKRKYYRYTSDHAYPRRHLYLNALSYADAREREMDYDFRFLTDTEARQRDTTHWWFPVRDIRNFSSSMELSQYIMEQSIANPQKAFEILGRLLDIYQQSDTIVYFLETSQNLDRVLDIFIRTNRQGQPLNRSDMLMSIATAQWTTLDARAEIYSLVDEINRISENFSFDKDWVLKTAMLLTDINDIAFNATNFDNENMTRIESKWHSLRSSMILTVQLIDLLGFSSNRLSSQYSLLPIAYYLHKRGFGSEFLTSSHCRDDREGIRGWFIRLMLKRGIWSYGTDSLLRGLRSTIRQHGHKTFPVYQLNLTIERQREALVFGEDELLDLAEVRSSDYRAYLLLSLLSPHLRVAEARYHIDHVFPKHAFNRRSLRNVGLSDDEIEMVLSKMDRLPNLQLLNATENIEKSNWMPHEWLNGYKDPESRNSIVQNNLLGDVPNDMSAFNEWYEARRERMLERLRGILGVASTGEQANDV